MTAQLTLTWKQKLLVYLPVIAGHAACFALVTTVLAIHQEYNLNLPTAISMAVLIALGFVSCLLGWYLTHSWKQNMGDLR